MKAVVRLPGLFFSPIKQWATIDPLLAKDALQELMTFWGRPERIRMDNGTPWGPASKLPSAMGLWLVGIGVDLIYGRPARSTDNAVVERSQGILAQWVEAQQCANFATCQQHLAWAVQTQRERYRSEHGQSRIPKHLDLYANPGGYEAQHDSQRWSRYRVRQYLSGFSFHRKVEKNGQITLFASSYSVGKPYARRYVEVHFDAVMDCWIICDEYGEEVRRHPAKGLSYELISQLRLAKRHRNPAKAMSP